LEENISIEKNKETPSIKKETEVKKKKKLNTKC